MELVHELETIVATEKEAIRFDTFRCERLEALGSEALNLRRSLLKPGTGRDSDGISRPVPATKTRDETVRASCLRASWH